MKSVVKTLKKHRVAYVYIAPFYLLFMIFGLFPMVSGFLLSFFRWDGLGSMRFLGMANYMSLFKDILFWRALGNTIFIGVMVHILN